MLSLFCLLLFLSMSLFFPFLCCSIWRARRWSWCCNRSARRWSRWSARCIIKWRWCFRLVCCRTATMYILFQSFMKIIARLVSGFRLARVASGFSHFFSYLFLILDYDMDWDDGIPGYSAFCLHIQFRTWIIYWSCKALWIGNHAPAALNITCMN